MTDKKKLRKEVLAYRNALSERERKEKSAEIARKVIQADAFKKSKIVLLYEAFRNEVATIEIYHEASRLGKEIYYPRVIGSEMEFYRVDETTEFEISRFGIREPKPETTVPYEPNKEDHIFLLMPGVAFDTEGNRIGYGGGYYDKYLQRLTDGNVYKNVCKVAVAYECQIVDLGRIETEPHDRKVDYIVTETKEIRRED